MKSDLAEIEKMTEENSAFRHVLYAGHHLRLALMALTPGQHIGMETHATHDRSFESSRAKSRS